MSPQSSTIIAIDTTFSGRGGGWLSNACSGASFVADVSWATGEESSIDRIKSESSSETPLDTLTHASQPVRKRSSSCALSAVKNQTFRSFYGSAYLPGIFAEISQASDEERVIAQNGAGSHVAFCCDRGGKPISKKARITCSSFFDIQPKSFLAQSDSSEGAISDLSLPTFVLRRTYSSAIKTELYSARERPDVAFPSLTQIPNAISHSSCTQIVAAMNEVGNHEDEQDGPPYGWFVSTEDEEAEDSAYIPTVRFTCTKPDLAFKMINEPTGANQELEVQQALAADTIDDVLGGHF